MNERIRELALQAELYVDLYGKPWPRAMSAEEADAAYKKFAQLIVLECIDVVDVGGEFVSRPKMVERLKKHFGVRE